MGLEARCAFPDASGEATLSEHSSRLRWSYAVGPSGNWSARRDLCDGVERAARRTDGQLTRGRQKTRAWRPTSPLYCRALRAGLPEFPYRQYNALADPDAAPTPAPPSTMSPETLRKRAAAAAFLASIGEQKKALRCFDAPEVAEVVPSEPRGRRGGASGRRLSLSLSPCSP